MQEFVNPMYASQASLRGQAPPMVPETSVPQGHLEHRARYSSAGPHGSVELELVGATVGNVLKRSATAPFDSDLRVTEFAGSNNAGDFSGALLGMLLPRSLTHEQMYQLSSAPDCLDVSLSGEDDED